MRGEKMENIRIISALIGLAGAVHNNGKTKDTDRIVVEALLSPDLDEVVERIHKEKFVIAPNCETCTTPCGNTSDYDVRKFDLEQEPIRRAKQEIAEILCEVAQDYQQGERKDLPEDFYKAISYLGYELTEDYYRKFLEEMKEW